MGSAEFKTDATCFGSANGWPTFKNMFDGPMRSPGPSERFAGLFSMIEIKANFREPATPTRGSASQKRARNATPLGCRERRGTWRGFSNCCLWQPV